MKKARYRLAQRQAVVIAIPNASGVAEQHGRRDYRIGKYRVAQHEGQIQRSIGIEVIFSLFRQLHHGYCSDDFGNRRYPKLGLVIDRQVFAGIGIVNLAAAKITLAGKFSALDSHHHSRGPKQPAQGQHCPRPTGASNRTAFTAKGLVK